MKCKTCGLSKLLHRKVYGISCEKFQPEDEKKAIIKEFEGEDWISLESLREIDFDEIQEVLHNA